jgi:hypothetical protein
VCTSDGRGAEAELTDSGLARLRSASATHLRGVESYFLGVIPPDDLGIVERSLGGVASRVAARLPGTPPAETDDD